MPIINKQLPSRFLVEQNFYYLDIEKKLFLILDNIIRLFKKGIEISEKVAQNIQPDGSYKNAKKYLFAFKREFDKNEIKKKYDALDPKFDETNLKKKYDEHPEAYTLHILSTIETYDAFQVQLVKFYCRLFWILQKGNLDYPNYSKIDTST